MQYIDYAFIFWICFVPTTSCVILSVLSVKTGLDGIEFLQLPSDATASL